MTALWDGAASASVDRVDEAVGSSVGGESDLPVLTMVRPMPGFPEQKAFVLVALTANGDSDDDEDEPVFYELHSLEQPALRFLVAVPGAFFSEYEVDVDDETCADLGLTAAEDALVLVVITLGQQPTANLMAPVVINSRTRRAVQVILSGTDWPVRAPLA